jgi:hypothetical protein
MRMLLQVHFPHGKFNDAVRDGTIAKKIGEVIEETKPEAVYFTEYSGRRSVIMIVEVADPSEVPALAEPWFLQFDADVKFHVVMSPDDLAASGLEALGKKWS